jgi:hypothetical protein
MKHTTSIFFSTITIIFLFAACTSVNVPIPSPSPKLISTETASPLLEIPTNTSLPTETPTPAETATATETVTATATVAAQVPEIVWDLKDPEEFPTADFEYLTSTEFAQQVLEWEDQGRFPEVPDTAVPFQGIDVLYGVDDWILEKYGFRPIYNLSMVEVKSQTYQNHPEKVPYILAGVWKTEYQNEKFYFIVKKWLNKNNSAGFEAFIYKSRSSNPQAIKWELNTLWGFGSNTLISTGTYIKSGAVVSKLGSNGCEAYFQLNGGNPKSTLCNWYFDNPDLVNNEEFYNKWEKSGIISNFITVNGQRTPFIPISPIGGTPINGNQ